MTDRTKTIGVHARNAALRATAFLGVTVPTMALADVATEPAQDYTTWIVIGGGFAAFLVLVFILSKVIRSDDQGSQ